ncbi:MAG: HAD family hydrolase [Phycisphaeraceae bacterium]|nr:HAD family hydrolase [Phycisphaeraceae bacterium]
MTAITPDPRPSAALFRELADSDLAAVLFDYGNTLVEFNAATVSALNGELESALASLYGSVDRQALDDLRQHQRLQPYSGEFRENDFHRITISTVRALFDRHPTPEEIDAIMRARYESFLRHVRIEPGIDNLLEALGRRYCLGLVSNYPDGQVIRHSLRNLGLDAFFGDRVVVSGDVGHVKPHPLPFRTLLERIDLEPEQCLYVGDNWLGDIQGAKRLGMRAVLIRQYELVEHFDSQPGDHEPDAIIEHIDELRALV